MRADMTLACTHTCAFAFWRQVVGDLEFLHETCILHTRGMAAAFAALLRHSSLQGEEDCPKNNSTPTSLPTKGTQHLLCMCMHALCLLLHMLLLFPTRGQEEVLYLPAPHIFGTWNFLGSGGQGLGDNACGSMPNKWEKPACLPAMSQPACYTDNLTWQTELYLPCPDLANLVKPAARKTVNLILF